VLKIHKARTSQLWLEITCMQLENLAYLVLLQLDVEMVKVWECHGLLQFGHFESNIVFCVYRFDNEIYALTSRV
jgi:hypothetical protein